MWDVDQEMTAQARSQILRSCIVPFNSLEELFSPFLAAVRVCLAAMKRIQTGMESYHP